MILLPYAGGMTTTRDIEVCTCLRFTVC